MVSARMRMGFDRRKPAAGHESQAAGRPEPSRLSGGSIYERRCGGVEGLLLEKSPAQVQALGANNTACSTVGGLAEA